MALAQIRTGSSNFGNTAATNQSLPSVLLDTNTLGVLVVVNRSGSSAGTVVDNASRAWTHVSGIANGTNSYLDVYIYYNATGAQINVTLTIANPGAGHCAAEWLDYSGGATAPGYTGAVTTNSGSGTVASASLVTTATFSLVLGCWGAAANVGFSNGASDHTDGSISTNSGTNDVTVAVSDSLTNTSSSGTAITMSDNWASTATWSGLALELLLTAGATTAPLVLTASATTSSVTGVPSIASSGGTLNTGLRASFHLDDATGSTAADATANANTLTWVGTLGAQWDTGKISGDAVFNGTNNAIGRGTSIVTTVSNWSLAGWIKPSVLPQSGTVIGNGTNAGGFSFGLGDSFDVSSSHLIGLFGGKRWIPTTYTFATANTWYHVVFTNDGTNTTFYVNGAQVYTDTGGQPLTLRAGFAIGNQESTQTRFFKGAIDEVAVWNRAITATEITALYNGGAGLQLPQATTTPAPLTLTASTTTSLSSGVPGVAQVLSVTSAQTTSSGSGEVVASAVLSTTAATTTSTAVAPLINAIALGLVAATTISTVTGAVSAGATLLSTAATTTSIVTAPALLSLTITPATTSSTAQLTTALPLLLTPAQTSTTMSGTATTTSASVLGLTAATTTSTSQATSTTPLSLGGASTSSSSSGNATKTTTLVFAAFLTTSGVLSRLSGKALSGAVSLFGLSLLRSITHMISGGLFFSGALVRQTARFFVASLPLAGTLLRRTAHVLAGATTPVGNLGRSVRTTLSAASLSLSSGFLRQTLPAFTASLSLSGTRLVRTSRVLAASLSASGLLAFGSFHALILAASFAASGALSRLARPVLSGSIALLGRTSRQTTHAFAASVLLLGSLPRQTIHALGTGSLALSGLLTSIKNVLVQTYTQALAGGLSLGSSLVRRTTHLFVSSLSFSQTLIRQTDRAFSSAVQVSGAVTRQSARALAASVSFAGTLTRQTRHTVAGVLSLAGFQTASRVFTAALLGTLAASGAVARVVQKAFVASLAFSVTFGRQTRHVLVASLATTGTLILGTTARIFRVALRVLYRVILFGAGVRQSVFRVPRRVVLFSLNSFPGGSMQAQPTNATSITPFIGTKERNISFSLDFTAWLGNGETLVSVGASVGAVPTLAPSSPQEDVTATLLQQTNLVGTSAIVTLGNATAVTGTTYLVIVTVATSLSRTLEAQFPPIVCPA